MKKTFRPYWFKDYRFWRLAAFALLELLWPALYVFLRMTQPNAPPDSVRASAWILGMPWILFSVFFIPIIRKLLLEQVAITEKEVAVGFGRKKTVIPLTYVTGLKFVNVFVSNLQYAASYDAATLVYKKDGKEHEVRLPLGLFYLDPLIEELKRRLGDRFHADEKTLRELQRWAGMPFLKKLVLFAKIIIGLAAYLGLPMPPFIWMARKLSLDLNEYTTWLIYGVILIPYTWILIWFYNALFAIRKKRGKR